MYDEDESPPLAAPTDWPKDPPDTTPPVEAGADPVLAALERIEYRIADIGMELNAVSHKADAAIAEARAAHTAAVCASDAAGVASKQSSAVAKMIREEMMGSLAEIDGKVESIGTRIVGMVDSLATVVVGHKHVLAEHQRRLDASDEERLGVNGNGATDA